MNSDRIGRMLQAMKKEGIDQMIVSSPQAIFYLTGVSLDPMERLYVLLLGQKEQIFFLNTLFVVPQKLPVQKVWLTDDDDAAKRVASYLQEGVTVGVDKNFPARFLLPVLEERPTNTYVNASYVLDYLRMQKDEQEQKLMIEVSRLNDLTMGRMIPLLSKGPSEVEMLDHLKSLYAKEDIYEFSFVPIISYGANAADPHHDCDATKPRLGDSIVIDIGGIKDGYCSDMTRTVFYGEVSDEQREVYEIVLEANLRGIAAAKPGARFCDVDRAARDYIESKGYGEYFTHRTGHSIGLSDHEFGDVSSVNTDVILPGMIFSVEPGIYIPGEFGVRIEDLLLITEDGNVLLNHYPKDLTVIQPK